MSLFEQWLKAWQQARDLPPERIAEVACPSCGAKELQLRFVDQRADGKAYADFWCSHCLKGISLEPGEVPAAYQSVRRQDAHIPRYQGVPRTVYEEWAKALYQASRLPPERIAEVVCPNCGARALHLRFLGYRPDSEDGDARVAFWCDQCLEGIALERYEVPDAYQQIRDNDAPIPSYRLAPLTLWEQWFDARLQAGGLPPERLAELVCPSCGARALQLRYITYRPGGWEYAAFWCDQCLQGIMPLRSQAPAAYHSIPSVDADIPKYHFVLPD